MVKSLRSGGLPSTAQVTGMLGPFELAPMARTRLVGGVLSTPLVQIGVFVAGGSSNRIEAPLLIIVPDVSPFFGITVNSTLPSPSGGVTLGGRNPSLTLCGACPVTGSIEL